MLHVAIVHCLVVLFVQLSLYFCVIRTVCYLFEWVFEMLIYFWNIWRLSIVLGIWNNVFVLM